MTTYEAGNAEGVTCAALEHKPTAANDALPHFVGSELRRLHDPRGPVPVPGQALRQPTPHAAASGLTPPHVMDRTARSARREACTAGLGKSGVMLADQVMRGACGAMGSGSRVVSAAAPGLLACQSRTVRRDAVEAHADLRVIAAADERVLGGARPQHQHPLSPVSPIAA